MLSIQRVSAGTLYGAFSVSKMTLQASNLKATQRCECYTSHLENGMGA